MSKSLFQSRTFWLAAVQAVVAAFVVFQTAYPEAGWLLMAKSVVDIFLRYVTEKPIARLV